MAKSKAFTNIVYKREAHDKEAGLNSKVHMTWVNEETKAEKKTSAIYDSNEIKARRLENKVEKIRAKIREEVENVEKGLQKRKENKKGLKEVLVANI